MRYPSLCLGLFVAFASVLPTSFVAAADWRPLFNGKDLTGWELYLAAPPANLEVPGAARNEKGAYTAPLGINHDPLKIVSVVESDGRPALRLTGEIHGGLATLESFENYRLKLQFRWGQRRPDQKPDQLANSGIVYHGFGEHGSFKGRWLQGHQFQLQPGNCGDYVSMGDGAGVIKAVKDGKRSRSSADGAETVFSNVTPDAPNCGKQGENFEKGGGEWNTLEIECIGDTCRHFVNGREVISFRSVTKTADGKTTPLTRGRIQLQMEGWEILVRDIAIRPVTAAP